MSLSVDLLWNCFGIVKYNSLAYNAEHLLFRTKFNYDRLHIAHAADNVTKKYSRCINLSVYYEVGNMHRIGNYPITKRTATRGKKQWRS